MSPIQNLVSVFFITQLSAIILLIVAYAFNYNTFKQVATGRLAVVPGLVKIAKLFRLSNNPIFQIIYLFSAIMTLFSYMAFILLIVYTVGWFLGLL